MSPRACHLYHLFNPRDSGPHWDTWNLDPWNLDSLGLWLSHVRGLLSCPARKRKPWRHHKWLLVDIQLLSTLGWEPLLSACSPTHWVECCVLLTFLPSFPFPSGFGQHWLVKRRSFSQEGWHLWATMGQPLREISLALSINLLRLDSCLYPLSL